MRVTADPRACPGTGCCHRGILRSAHRPRLVDTIDTAIFSRRRAAGQTGLTSEAMRDYRSSTSFRRVQSLPWTPSLTVTMPANTNKAMMPTSTNVITEIDSFLRKRVAHSAARPNRGCVARTRGERRDDRGHHPVQTASGATAVQVVYSKRRGARRMEHIGSAHDDQEVEALKAAARQRRLAGSSSSISVWTPTMRRWPGRVRCRSWPRGWSHPHGANPRQLNTRARQSGPHLDIEGVPDPEHVPWIDPTHPA